MANYSGTPGQKKLRMMEQREEALRRCIRRDATPDECAEAAQLLRVSAIAYYHAVGRPEGSKARAWRERTLESILREYGAIRGSLPNTTQEPVSAPSGVRGSASRTSGEHTRSRFGTDTWTLEWPDGWRGWHDEECVTLVGPGDRGALQISAAFKDAEVLDQDLCDFASDHLEAGAQPRASKAGDYVGFEIAFSDGGTFWRKWFLRCGKQALFVTYNCALELRGVEDEPVRQALASLRQTRHDVA